MIPARAWTDGACSFDGTAPELASRGYGGWAMLVDRAGYRYLRRGRVPATTAVEMELTAIIEALRSLPPACPTTVYTDSTLPFVIEGKWRDGRARHDLRCHQGLWADLIEQFERVRVTFELLTRGPRGDEHELVDEAARAEARALKHGLPFPHLLDNQQTRRTLPDKSTPTRVKKKLRAGTS